MAFKEKIKNLTKHPVSIVLLLILAVEFAYLIRYNLVHTYAAMDQDAAKLMTHTIEIVKTGKLLIPGWRYMTTHEIDSAMFLAIPFYAITKNLYLSFALSNTIYMFVLLFVLIGLFKNFDIKSEIALLVCCLIYVPYSFGMLDYMNMLFIRGGQYSIKILIPLLAILILTFPDKNKKRDLTLSAIWLFLVYMSAFSSGLFPFVTGILPIAGAYFVNAFFRKKDTGSINAFRTCLLIAGTVLSLIGFAVHQHYDISPSGINATLTYSEEFGDRIFVNIGYFFNLFNALPSKYYDEYSIVSAAGVGYILRFVFAVFLLLTAFHFVVLFFGGRENRPSGDKAHVATGYLSAIVIVNVLIHLLCSYDTSRYYLIEAVCMIILAGIYVSRLTTDMSKLTQTTLWICICLGVCGIWYSSKKYVETCQETKNLFGFCYGISDFIRAQNVDNVIILDNTEVDEICRILLPETKVSNYNSVDDEYISYDWYIATGDRSYYGDSSIVVSQYYDDLTPVFGSEVASHYEFIGQVNGFNMFRSDEFCLPTT